MTKEQTIKDLMSLPNIGKTMANHLCNIGIRSSDEFKKKNPEKLWEKLKKSDTKSTICKAHLKALVAAHRGVAISQIKDI